MSELRDWRPRSPKIEHDWRCPQRPILQTVRDGKIINVCGHCEAVADDEAEAES